MKDQFLKKWANWWCLTSDARQLDEAFENELNEICKTANWISVKDTKPEIAKIVNLVLNHSKQDVYSGFRAHGGYYCFRIGEDSKQFIPNGIKEAEITHWMPLPSPPTSG